MSRPSKKIVLLVICLALLGIAIYALLKITQKETYTASNDRINAVQSAVLAKDSDNDGLKDWEEQLWKTDPYNPDTDGDGTPDGLEIKQGRNPLVAGPNDKLDTGTITNKINTETEKDLTDTDKFSRELFIKIIAAKNNNTPPTEADIQNFLNTTINKEVQAQQLNNFTSGDLNIDKTETPETIKTYGNIIAAILTKKPKNKLEYEIIIMDRAEKNNDPAELKKLEPLVSEYKRIQNDLLSVTVPQSATSFHLALINSVAGMAYSITGMEYLLTDPIKSLPGVSSYSVNSQNFMASIRQFNQYFNSVGVSFSGGDAAYNFFSAL